VTEQVGRAADGFPADPVERVAFIAVLAFVGALQFSIAAANICLTVALVAWVAVVVRGRESVEMPGFWPALTAYGGITLISAAFSLDRTISLIDCKQLVLFLIVPLVYRVARGERALTVANVAISLGAAAALFGIFQYGVLEYDNLGRRPQGTLTHYMTYSGILMLVTTIAVARVLFRRVDRTWPALVLPALLVALTLTFTRSAWVGACVGIALLLALKDRRLLAVLPVLAALFFALAPGQITDRVYSMFDMQDPSNRDRFAMMRSGVAMVEARPLTGVGPDMVSRVYEEYRDPLAVEPMNPHLHNVPIQIAAERGLPALGIWLWFIVTLVARLLATMRTTRHPFLAATALAAIASMLAAGLFEYNFGDSEFLMLFLVLITLPFAADRAARAR
jgi:O-antigen ligase